MKKVKIYYLAFGNFGSHKILELEEKDVKNKDLAKLIIYNMIKDEPWDWEFTYADLAIGQMIEQVKQESK